MAYIRDLYKDEMRSGFLVTTNRKKLWNCMLGLTVEMQRICKKHDISYYAYAGTLLGAVRHKGFIPWDDDMDFAMPLKDYWKFIEVCKDEVKPPYFLDIWYENDVPDDWPYGWPTYPLLKLRDERTMMLETPDCKTMHQGIWIDIFPLYAYPPFADGESTLLYAALREMMLCCRAPQVMRQALEGGADFAIDKKSLREYLRGTFRQRAQFLEKFSREHFLESGQMATPNKIMFGKEKNAWKGLWTEARLKKLELPFEKISVAASVKYDEALTEHYGDYRELVVGNNHALTYSVDVSYKEYFGI